MTCIAIDDEPLALAVIDSFCRRRGGIVLTVFSEPKAGLAAIRERVPDMVFLDIRMNGVSGLEIARELRGRCAVIFTTAYADFAIDGFELDAVDFLHKPFSYERFERAVTKAVSILNQTLSEQESQIVVREEYANVPIRTDEIAYIEGMGNYVKIFLVSGDCVMTRTNLKNILSMLPPSGFVRIHKSYAVPVRFVRGFTKNRLELHYGDTALALPVGRAYWKSLYGQI